MHDNYKPLALQPGQGPLHLCPVCGAAPELWQYSEDEDSPVLRVVMCSNGDEFGPQKGMVNEGCLLYMPPSDFYQPLARQAIAYWNEYSEALVAQRMGRALG